MTSLENTQPRAADGKWLPTSRREPNGVVLSGQRGLSRLEPIMATVDLQEWNDDEAEDAGTVEFDAAPILAGIVPNLTTEELANLDYSTRDDIFNEAMARGFVPIHDGPFELHVQESLDAALSKNPAYFDTPYPHEKTVRHPDVVIQSPLSAYEMGFRADSDGYVETLAVLDIDEMSEQDPSDHWGTVSRTVTGGELLMDMNRIPHSVSTHKDSGAPQAVFRITGDVSAAVECMSDEEQDLFEAGMADAAALQGR
ncbi:hypothetical protein [Arthrobacter caoxuetaonis]|uniref:Uncharacterized protein n=1 Tax=Arthrobacter caoxuetaonis TaxID=2886935 RepID=A0A9X1MI80_9MICC|nr:hypothetical protein [Arthrobacter caoxuetaonis]MCC3299750.1 hypothetical protein [Arthrobacter caoxuetaonis]USQ59348.1 hypothetical protein NF551_17350 [Arthrobacter caoxuetaonis]